MDKIDKILKNDLFLYHLEQNRRAEKERIFCKHDMAHFLDVARIGALISVDEQMGIDREIIYAAALLHDLGKHTQYENGTPHEVAGGQIAPVILKDCGFSDEETKMITDAIISHRDASARGEKNLKGILYRADKASRACFACDARMECSWADEKKNLMIRF